MSGEHVGQRTLVDALVRAMPVPQVECTRDRTDPMGMPSAALAHARVALLRPRAGCTNKDQMMNAPEVIDVLNELIETCKDGEYGFRASAEQAHSRALCSSLLARSSECATASDQLRAQVLQLGGKPENGGSAAGAVHRGWVAVKATLSNYDDLAVLEECERGEDVALATYRDALDRDLPEPIRGLIERQYEGAKRNHLEVRNMRDALRATARP
jgi:uncharacterized protein (TIGR02284 family)